jgi:hypothetical protein
MIRHLSSMTAGAVIILALVGCAGTVDHPEDNTAKQLQRLAPPLAPTVITRRG